MLKSEKEKYFLNIILHFLNLDSILNIFKKKITLLAHVFLNLWTPKKVVNTCYRQSVGKQTVQGFSISIRQTFSNWITFRVINKYVKGAVV